MSELRSCDLTDSQVRSHGMQFLFWAECYYTSLIIYLFFLCFSFKNHHVTTTNFLFLNWKYSETNSENSLTHSQYLLFFLNEFNCVNHAGGRQQTRVPHKCILAVWYYNGIVIGLYITNVFWLYDIMNEFWLYDYWYQFIMNEFWLYDNHECILAVW